MNIYVPLNPFINHADTILTGTHQSLYCTHVVCTGLLSVTSFMMRHLGPVQCLLSEGVL